MNIPQISKDLWEEFEWAKKNYRALQEKYKDLWVTIHNKRIITFGKSLKKVESEAEKIVGEKEVLTIYIESGAAIY